MILKPLYKVDLIEKDGQHFYAVDGSETHFPGVTGILGYINKPFLQPWIAKVTAEYIQRILTKVSAMHHVTRKPGIHSINFPDERFLNLLVRRAKLQHRFIKESAERIGSEAHKQFDFFIKGEQIWPLTFPFSESFNYWKKKEKLKIICCDTKLASLKYGYGGAMDVGLEDSDGKLVIGDFKTGKSIHDDHAYQVGGAYAQAAKETFGLDYVPRAVIIRFERNKKKYQRWEVRDHSHAFRGFMAAFELKKVSEEIHFTNQEIIKEKKVKIKKIAPESFSGKRGEEPLVSNNRKKSGD